MGLNVAVLANLKKNAPHYAGMPADAWDDLDSDITVNAIVAALEAGGHRATFLEGNLTLVDDLAQAEARHLLQHLRGALGRLAASRTCRRILEMLRIPYTGQRRADPGADPGQADDQARAGVPRPADARVPGLRARRRAARRRSDASRCSSNPAARARAWGSAGNSIVHDEARAARPAGRAARALPPADPGRALHPRPRGDGRRDRQL